MLKLLTSLAAQPLFYADYVSPPPAHDVVNHSVSFSFTDSFNYIHVLLIFLIPLVIPLLLGLFLLVASWRVYVKAGLPGWGVLVPVYNLYLWCTIAGKPGWWLLLLFVPFVNLAVILLLSLGVAKAFNKSESFGVLLALLAPVAVPILAFTEVVYTPPGCEAGGGLGGNQPARGLITEQRRE